MRVLITGASGRIGFELAKSMAENGHRVAGTFLEREVKIKGVKMFKTDLLQEDEVETLFAKAKPELVIHSASLTNVDLCEEDTSKAFESNVRATENVISECKKSGAKLVYISTSFVFDGSKKIYHEDDAPNPMNYYGKTKLQGEEIVKNSGLKFLILRTDQPYSWTENHGRDNFIFSCIKKFDSGKEFKIFSDWLNSPTLVEDFVSATQELLAKNKVGIYNVVGSDFVNRFEWAQKIADVFGKDKNLVKSTKSKIGDVKARRPNVRLSIEKLEKEGIKMRGVVEGMRYMKTMMKGA